MQLKKVSIGQAFRFVDSDLSVHAVLDSHTPTTGTRGMNLLVNSDLSVYMVLDSHTPTTEIRVMDLSLGLQCYVTGEQEVELVTFLPIVLEPEDLENLDLIIEIEGEDEDRNSRVTRLLEGSEGAIAAELNYFQVFHS